MDNKNIVHETMENIVAPWYGWCRLCAKEDPENSVRIHSKGSHQRLTDDDVKLSLKEALEKYFCVLSSCEDLLPKLLCLDCYSLISSIMFFNEHVERVQQMYTFLVDNPVNDSGNLQAIRMKFDVCDDNKEQWCRSQDRLRESVTENIQNTKNNEGADNFTPYIKEENWSIESDHSEYEENNDVYNESKYHEEALEEGKDPFDTMADDYIWGEEQKIVHKGDTKRRSIRNKKYTDPNTVETSKNKTRQNSFTDIHCKKTKTLTEDFVHKDDIDNDSREEDEDPFETMSEDSVWGEDEEKMYPNNTKKKSAGESKRKLRQSNVMDIDYKEKKNFGEDFVLDVACAVCDQKFGLYSSYCEHMEESHNNANMEKYCPLCDRTLQTWYHLGRHMRIHMPLETRYPIKCPECDNRYTTTALLEVHINHKHRNEKPFICEVCGFSGATKNSLTQHMYVHTDNAPFECEVCKKRFKKRSRLNFHMDIHAPNKFICSICGLQLSSRATLKNHLLVHSDEKRHKCDYCNATFKRSKALKAHLILHTGLKPYTCNFCDLAFSNRNSCRLHMKKMHPEEVAKMDSSGNKPYTKNVPTLVKLKEVTKTADNLIPVDKYGYKYGRPKSRPCIACKFCDGRFSYRSSLKTHMKVKHPDEFALLETNDKNKSKPRKAVTKVANPKIPTEPVTCDICGRPFGHRKLCRNHMKRIHPDEFASLEALGNKTHTKKISKSETQNEVTKALQSIEEKPPSPLDLTPCASTVAATNIRDLFILID